MTTLAEPEAQVRPPEPRSARAVLLPFVVYTFAVGVTGYTGEFGPLWGFLVALLTVGLFAFIGMTRSIIDAIVILVGGTIAFSLFNVVLVARDPGIDSGLATDRSRVYRDHGSRDRMGDLPPQPRHEADDDSHLRRNMGRRCLPRPPDSRGPRTRRYGQGRGHTRAHLRLVHRRGHRFSNPGSGDQYLVLACKGNTGRRSRIRPDHRTGMERDRFLDHGDLEPDHQHRRLHRRVLAATVHVAEEPRSTADLQHGRGAPRDVPDRHRRCDHRVHHRRPALVPGFATHLAERDGVLALQELPQRHPHHPRSVLGRVLRNGRRIRTGHSRVHWR